MSDEQVTVGYIECPNCQTVNYLNKIDKKGVYSCGKCQYTLITVDKAKKNSLIDAVIIAGFIGIAGYIGIPHLSNWHQREELIYTELNTSWSERQVEYFEAKCKASLSQKKLNLTSEKITKSCICLTSYIVQNSSINIFSRYDQTLLKKGAERCKI